MLNVFIYDASTMTDELMQARLDNMLARRDHLENFVKSLAANPKQFPDYGHRLNEIKAPALVIWGRDDRFVPMDVALRLVWVAECRFACARALRALDAVGACRAIQSDAAGLPTAIRSGSGRTGLQ
ncbi:hypothetical protein CBA19CS11_35265 [Caballeronia novacaledonica]|nr:hypothetical protein CBA19CS11_35265 [Caballeronia novacaledonica]